MSVEPKYIDANQLWKCSTCMNHRYEGCSLSSPCTAGEQYSPDCEKLKFAEVFPVRYGKWKSFGLSALECSVCGFVDNYKMYYNNCPECQSRMRENDNDNKYFRSKRSL